VHWWIFLTTVNEFNNGRTAGLSESSPWWTFLLGGLLFSVPAFIALKPLVQKSPADPSEQRLRENLSLLLILCMVPVLAGYGLILSGAYNIRYVIFVCVPYYLLVARGICVLDRAWLGATLVIASLAYSGYSLQANYFVPYIEDYRGAYAYLAQARKPDDCYVVPHPWLQHDAPWGWSIYHESQSEMSMTTLDAIASGQKSCPRVWLMTISRSDPFAVSESTEAREVLEQDHLRVEERRFFWIDLDLYVPKSR
jgi:hypothetical protein